MSYYFSRTLDIGFDEAIERTKAVLAEHGFGVLTEIDVKATLKKKLYVDFRNYRILGACNPSNAYKALTLEDKIGLMLPCNVIVQENPDGGVEVAAIDPLESMKTVENPELVDVAMEVQSLLQKVIQNL